MLENCARYGFDIEKYCDVRTDNAEETAVKILDRINHVFKLKENTN